MLILQADILSLYIYGINYDQEMLYIMEIERKFLIRALPENLDQYPHCHITQGYINTNPVIRLRRKDSEYILTVKGSGLLEREEVEFPLEKSVFDHLMTKVEGCIIKKMRYKIPWNSFIIELDVFEGAYSGFRMAEIEFPDREIALNATVPEWFGPEVTMDSRFHNSSLSSNHDESISEFMKYQHDLLTKGIKI